MLKAVVAAYIGVMRSSVLKHVLVLALVVVLIVMCDIVCCEWFT